jgi:hypothetical protein
MTIQDVSLTHSLVNSGTAVTLKGAKVGYKWKSLTNCNPAVAKFDVVPGNYQGFENPTITITGVINQVDLGTNDLTQQHLVNFCTLLSTIPISLIVPTSSSGTAESPFSATPTYLGGRPSGGYKTDGTNTLSNSINIIISDFSIDIDSSSELGHIWNYTISVQEVL